MNLSRSVRDAFGRGYSRKRSECGARGRNDTVRSRAASGIMLSGTTAGPGGAFPGLGQAGAGNARLAAQSLSPPGWGELTRRALLPRPRKPGLELSERGESPYGESRGGTPSGERATITRAPHPLMRNIETYACRRSASLFFVLEFSRVGRAKAEPTQMRAYRETQRRDGAPRLCATLR